MKNINTIKYIILITVILFGMGINKAIAQPCGAGVGTVLFNEDFEGEADGATSGTDASGTAWTATCPGCAASDFFEVDNNSGNAMGCNGTNGLRGNDTNGPGTFTATVDLTGCEVVYFGFDYCASGYTGSGNLECVTECGGCSGVPSEGVSNGGCNNCWDFLYGELNWGSGSAQQILLGDDCDAPPSGTTGNAICGSTDADGNPIPPADLTSVDINIVMAMWAGTENMVIDNVMIICYSAAEVAACADPAVADACPEPPCPDFTGIAAGDLDVGVTESTCPAGDMTPSGGTITAPATMCPAGSTLQYSFDNFATAGTTTLPTYDQSNTLTVTTSCVCDADATLSSTVSTVTTVPGMCAMCDAAIAASTPAVTVDSESTCAMAGGTLMGGAISAATCPAGSTVEYSTDGTNWSATLPTYDQNNPIMVTSRCVCDIDPTVIGTGSPVSTVPGVCPPPAGTCNACDCNSVNVPMDSYTINTVADNSSQAGYTLTYALTSPAANFATSSPAAGSPASFPGLPYNTAYDVCAFNVLDGDLAGFQAALTSANTADAIAGNAPFDAFCFEVICTTFPAEDCMCETCPDPSFTCNAMVNLCGGEVALNAVDIGTNGTAATDGTWSGTGAFLVNTQGTPAVADDTLDPSLGAVGVTYTITLSMDGQNCTETFDCTFTIFKDCEANGGSFPSGN